MKIQVDVKSCLLGLAAGVILVLTVGAAAKSNLPAGRFQIAAGQEHGFIIDTATGRVWLGHFPTGVGNTDNDFLRAKIAE